MRTKSIFISVLMILSFSLVNAQVFPAKHRGTFPRLLADGKVIDVEGKQLGSISNDGKVYEVTGKLIAIISETGEVSYANGRGVIGIIENATLKTEKGMVITTDADGVVMVSGRLLSFVDKGYPNQSHGCVVYYFFSTDNKEARLVDQKLML